jgi:hypothetical protein
VTTQANESEEPVKKWGSSQKTNYGLGNTLIKMSIQDAHLIRQIASYMAKIIQADLTRKLRQIYKVLLRTEDKKRVRKSTLASFV